MNHGTRWGSRTSFNESLKARQIQAKNGRNRGAFSRFVPWFMLSSRGAERALQMSENSLVGSAGFGRPSSKVAPSTPFRRTAIFAVAALLAPFGVLGSVLLFSQSPAEAAINEQLHFQARLLSAAGSTPADGDYNVQFNIYSGGDGDPGTADETLRWTGSYLKGNTQAINVVNGYVSAQLGESSSAQVNTLADVPWDNGTLWLSINIGDATSTSTTCSTEANFNTNCGGDGEMGPFLRLGATPYAFNAKELGGRNETEFVQLNPGASPQNVSTANSAIAVNQQGAGNVLQLQSGGNDVLVVNNSGTATISNDVVVNGNTTIGSNSSDTLSINSVLQGANALVFEGASADGFETTLAIEDPTADVTLRLPALAAGTYDLCTTSGNCNGLGDILQGGNTYGAAIRVGSNDGYDLEFETSDTLRVSINATTGNVTLTSDLAVNGDDITSDGNLTVNANGYVRIGDTGTPGTASGDDDLYVEGDLEVDGSFIYGANATASAWGLNGISLQAVAATYTDSSTAGSGTATNAVFNSFAAPTLAASNTSVTTTNAATVYIQGAPIAGSNQTITNTYAMWVDGGLSRFDSSILVGDAEIGNAAFLAEFQGINSSAIAVTAGDASSSASIYLGVEGNETGQGALAYDNNTDIMYLTANGGSGTITLDANSTLTVGTNAATGELSISDGSSNYATINVSALAGNYTVSIPTITGNDEFCLESLANCSGANEFTYVVAASDSVNAATADYTADGTSDEDQINSAITAANTAGGGKVLLLEGTYIIDGTIDIKSDVELVGSGVDATEIKFGDNTNLSTFVITESTNPSNFTIRDLSINANDSNNTGTQGGIALLTVGSNSGATSARGGLIENIEIFDLSDNGIYLDDADFTTVRNSHIYDTTTYGMWIDSGDTSRSILIQGNNIHDAGNHGISAIDAPGLTINGNTVSDNGTNGIHVESSNGAVISNNVTNSNSYGIRTNGGQVTITGNVSKANGVGIQVDEAGWANVTGNNVDGSTGAAGIGVSEGYYLTVNNNMVYNSTNEGILVSGTPGNDQISVSGNKISTTGGRAILLNSDTVDALIQGNSIDAVGEDGIETNGADDTLISNNSIYNVGTSVGTSSSILISGDSNDNSVTNNKIRDTAGTGYAIDIAAAADDTYLADNTYSGTGATSINDGGTNTIFANQLDSSGNIELQAGDSGVLQILSNTDITGTLTASGLIVAGAAGSNGTATGAGDLYVQDALEIDGNLVIGSSNTDTISINAGSSGSGITFEDDSFNSCVLTTSAAGVLTCGTTGSLITLQQAYVGGNTITATDAEGDIDLTVSEATNFSVDITGTGNFLVQDGGVNVLTVANGGATVLRNTTDTNAGFQVQTAGGSENLLTVDTIDNQVIIGDIAGTSSTSTLAVDRTVSVLGGALSTGTDTYLTNWTAGGADDYSRLNFVNYRGSSGSEAALQSGDVMGRINAYGWDTNPTIGGAIQFTAGAEWGTSGDASDAPTSIAFFTTPDGSANEVERLQISYTGQVIVNDPQSALTDFVVRGDTDANLLFVDASTDRIGIGDASPAALLTVGSGDLFQVNTSGDVTTAAGENLSVTTGTTGTLTLDSGTTGTVSLGTGTSGKTIDIGTGAAAANTINIGGTGANTIALGNTQTAGSISLGAAMTTGTINIGGTGLQTGTIDIGAGTGAQAINLGTGGTGAKTVTVGSTASTGVTTIQAGTGGVVVKPANGTTAFQVQNASSVSLFTVDTLNNTISLLGNNSGEPAAWATTTPIGNGAGVARDNANNGFIYNGYIYVPMGDNGTTRYENVAYAKVNGDGTISASAWGTTGSTSAPQRTYANSIQYNGYVYLLGGSADVSDADPAEEETYYAKINSDGTIGTWQTGTSMPAVRRSGTVAVINGYMYYIGGATGTLLSPTSQTTVYYARINADGSLGSWAAASNGLPVAAWGGAAVVANGRIYVVGGSTNVATSQDTTKYVRPDPSTGNITTAWTTDADVLPAGRFAGAAYVANGRIYYAGGQGGGNNPNVYYTTLAADGSIGAWTTQNTSNDLNTGRGTIAYASGNGYLYVLGGYNGSSAISSVEYTSLPRVRMAGSLDLVGSYNGNLSEIDGAGHLTAGNTKVVGSLEVQGSSIFSSDISVNGNINGALSIALGTPTTAGSLILSDGSSNTLTVATASISGNYTVTVPAVSANDTFCLATVGNCSGAGREFTAIVGKSGGSNASSNLSAANYTADGEAIAGTGTVDGDQVQINQAIDDVNTAGGGKVLLLEGTYTIDGTIDLDDDVEIVGSGQGATIITVSDSTNSSINFFTEDSNPDNWAIRDLSLDINSNGQTAGTYQGVVLSSASATAGRGGVIDNVEMYDFTRSSDDAIDITNTYNITISDSLFYNGNTAIQVTGDGDTDQRMTIINNKFTDIDTDGVSLSNVSGVVIDSNVFFSLDGTGGSNAAIDANGAWGVSVTNNQIQQSSGTSFGIRMTGEVDFAVISGNTLEEMSRAGIWGQFQRGQITGNVLHRTDTTGASDYHGQIYLTDTAYTTVSNNIINGENTSDVGIRLDSDIGGPADNVFSGNVVMDAQVEGIFMESGSNRNTFSNNEIYSNGTHGIYGTSINGNLFQNNHIYDNTANTANDSIRIEGTSANNQLIGNRITDTQGSGYAINLNAAGVSSTYLANNTYSGTGASTINDSGTGTIYANQYSSATELLLRAPTTNTLTVDTGTTGILNLGTGTSGKQINIGTGNAALNTIAIGGTGANVITLGNTQTGGSISLGAAMTTGTINIGGTGAHVGTIDLGVGTGAQTINLGTGAGAKTLSVGSTNTTSSTTVQSGSNGISINVSATQQAIFAGSNTLYLGNASTAGTAASPNGFTVQGTGSSTAATAGGAVSLIGGTGNTSGVGGAVTIRGGTGGNAATGGVLTLQGGTAGGGNTNGGNVALVGGVGTGSGVKGLVVIDTPTFSTAGSQNCAAADCTITQANIDSYGAVIVTFSSTGLEAAMPDPNQTTAGRIVYVTAANGSSDFTLCLNDVAANAAYDGTCNTTTGNTIAMRANTTATLVWNGSDWTAAGASSSTDLQAAYNNTLTSAGGAELVLNASGGAADGLTVRNNATSPIVGGLLEVQTSIGSNLLSVNNNAVEYASNGGAETAGGSSSTFPSDTWDANATGGTITRYTTVGNYVATGQASVSVVTAAQNQGARNELSTVLTNGLTYKVSFAVRGTTNFSNLEVRYSPDGSNTGTVLCSTASANSFTATTGQWTRVTCSFVAAGAAANNAIIIRYIGASSFPTFYIDNLSVNVDASATYAADGSVDLALGSNWTAFGALDNLTRDTTTIFDTSGSVNVDAPNNADRGVSNNLAITPAVSTQYLVTFYARSSNTFNDIRVRYSRDGGTNFVSCVDYNTQTVSTTAFTEITCLFTTDSTTATNPDLVIDQPTASNRNFYIDALTVTLNTNNSNNVQVGGGNKGGPATLFTLDRSNGAPIAANNEAYLGSMYYDTSTGRIQCYEADGWGACGAAPDNVVNLNPEYAGAVLNGTGIGTMTTDFCSNDTALTVNDTLCDTGEAKNYYRWTSPQASQQTYSIYVTYQLPETFNGFASDDTVQLVGRVDSTSNASVTYEMYKSTGSAVTQCGSGETDVITGNSGVADQWYSYGINGNESTGCSFNSSSAGNFVIFKINMKANSNANAYISTLSFTTTGR